MINALKILPASAEGSNRASSFTSAAQRANLHHAVGTFAARKGVGLKHLTTAAAFAFSSSLGDPEGKTH